MSPFLQRLPLWLGLCLSLPLAWGQQTADTEDWNAKFQATYVRQLKPAFNARYSGPNSLSTDRELSYSFSGSASLGLRPWAGGEFYLNPEVGQGVPLSGLTGLAGFTNGEIARTSGPKPRAYWARVLLRQTWGLGGEREAVASDFNRLAGTQDQRRLVLTVGSQSVLDLFDQNRYAHDARTQFLNWSLFTHAAYDFAADARGYTKGVALEYFGDGWALRGGRFIQPKVPNQQQLDDRILTHFGDQIELETAHRLLGQEGRVRVLVYRNKTRMARFDDAIALGAQTATVPDLNAVRRGDQTRHGLGLNLEQALTPTLGLFARAMTTDGHTETYAFTEADRSLSMGLALQGAAWGRAQDQVGLALARNDLSKDRRTYLAQGGISFFIGDGRLNYRSETIAELYYNLALARQLWLSLDAQLIRNPAYNADRGPVKVLSARLHTEF